MDDLNANSAPSDTPNTSGSSPITAVPPRSTPRIHRVFIGRDGLRAGWRVLLYLVCVAVILTVLSLATRPFFHLDSHQPLNIWRFFIGEVESLVAALIPGLIFARWEKRPFGDYGLPAQRAFGKQFWVGVLWGICAISVLLAVMRGLGVFYYGALALHGVRVLKFAAFWGVFFLVVGFAEEFLLRGYTQFTLAKGMGFWPAAVLLSCAFGALHLGNFGESWVGALAAAFIGLFFCLTLRRTGALWFAVGMHASWDWGESFLYSVPDSGTVSPGHLLSSSFQGKAWLTGGSVGPEGSVLVFVLIALLWFLFDRFYPARTVRRLASASEPQPQPLPPV